MDPKREYQYENFMIYTDAEWVSDKTDRKIIPEGVEMFCRRPYSWESKKQEFVATSRTESEYIAQAMYAKQGKWAAQIFKDMLFPE